MKRFLLLFLLTTVLFSCATKEDTTIALNKVGVLTNTTTIDKLEQLFVNDSIVSRLTEGEFGSNSIYVHDDDTHLVYKKGGELLLSISPVNQLDSVSKVKSITVLSDVYKTGAGVGISSTFKDLNIQHNIEKLEATFHLVTVFVKDINATFTMEKQAVGVNDFTLGEIDKSQIPENATFTSMTIWME
ncbi:hypothetical protein [Wenyingzhuangia sp. IMCC45574]